MTIFVLHGIERIVITLGAIAFGVLGYRLFTRGLTRSKGDLEFSSPMAKVVFSGAGPGLFFMAFGAIILVVAMLSGGIKTFRQERDGEPTATVEVAPRAEPARTAELPEKPAPPTAGPPAAPDRPAYHEVVEVRQVGSAEVPGSNRTGVGRPLTVEIFEPDGTLKKLYHPPIIDPRLPTPFVVPGTALPESVPPPK
jgi:hypothetical protein